MHPNGSKAEDQLRAENAQVRRLRAVFRRTLIKTSTARVGPNERPEVRVARWVRRNPGLSAWAFLFVMVAVGVGQHHVAEHGWPVLRPQAKRLAELSLKAQRTVDEVVDEWVPGLNVGPVSAGLLPDGVAGRFLGGDKSIAVAVGLERRGEGQYLATICHEVVHAMFENIGAHEYWSTPVGASFLLKEELAAEVLAAHLAGRVWTKRGSDGEELTRRLVREFREVCDPNSECSYYQHFARKRLKHGERAVDEDQEYMALIHVGPPEWVDDMDRICCEHDDAWEAARAIKDKYLSWGEEQEKRWLHDGE